MPDAGRRRLLLPGRRHGRSRLRRPLVHPRLHYSFDYAVSVREVRAIIDDYCRRPAADFAFADYGFPLDEAEQRRRWVVKSLLRADGVDLAAYRARFGTDLAADLPHLGDLVARGWAARPTTRSR